MENNEIVKEETYKENKKVNEKKNRLPFILVITCIITIIIALLSYWWFNYKDLAVIQTQNPFQVFELGDDFDLNNIHEEKFIKNITFDKNLKKTTKDEVLKNISFSKKSQMPDLSKVGKYKIELDIKSSEKYDTKIIGNKSFDLEVKDTKKPIVKVKNDILLEYGEKLALKDIEKSLSIQDKSKTTIEANLKAINTKKSGKHNLDVIVKDIFNNDTKVKIKILVDEKQVDNITANSNSSISKNTDKNINVSKISGPWIVDGNVPASKVREINNEWNKIPPHLRNLIINKGWKLYITSYNIADKYYSGSISYGSIAGLTKYNVKKIYVNYKGNRISRATIHEIGHALDKEFGFISNTMEFLDIYEDEKYKMKEHKKVDNHNISNRTEYFAQIFLEYCKYPSSLKKSAPRSYKFIDNYIINQN